MALGLSDEDSAGARRSPGLLPKCRNRLQLSQETEADLRSAAPAVRVVTQLLVIFLARVSGGGATHEVGVFVAGALSVQNAACPSGSFREPSPGRPGECRGVTHWNSTCRGRPVHPRRVRWSGTALRNRLMVPWACAPLRRQGVGSAAFEVRVGRGGHEPIMGQPTRERPEPGTPTRPRDPAAASAGTHPIPRSWPPPTCAFSRSPCTCCLSNVPSCTGLGLEAQV